MNDNDTERSYQINGFIHFRFVLEMIFGFGS